MSNPAFSLVQIRPQRWAISASVSNPAFSLVQSIDPQRWGFYAAVSNPAFSLVQIRPQRWAISASVSNPAFSLVQSIDPQRWGFYAAVSNPAFSLVQIRPQRRNICTVQCQIRRYTPNDEIYVPHCQSPRFNWYKVDLQRRLFYFMGTSL